jgi:PAS domain S-box-containing protein
MAGASIKILLVEDNPGDARLVRAILNETSHYSGQHCFQVIHVERLNQALAAVKTEAVDLILLDLSLPDSYGLDTIHQMLEAAPKLPIVVMSGLNDQKLGVEAVKIGAQDYLIKGDFNEHLLPRAIHYAIERKRSEEALRQSEAFNRTILDSLTAHIAVLDQAGTITAVNQAWEQFGRENGSPSLAQSSIGLNYLDVCRQAMGEEATLARAALQGIQAVLSGSQSLFTLEYPCHAPEGMRWFVMRVTPFLGGHSSVVVTHENITERKLAEEEISRRNQELAMLSTVIEQAVENVVITDPDGTIIYVNPSFERLSGYSRAEVIGQNPRLLKSGKQDTAFYREMWSAIRSGQIWHGRLVNKKKNGALYTEEATISPIRNEAGEIVNYVAVKRDVTRELQLEEQYYQAQKMEALGRLTGGIVHDFNNLLTAINGSAEMIQMNLAPDDPNYQTAEVILRSGERAANLIRQLLIFSRKQVAQPEVVNLNTIIIELTKMLGRIIGEHIQIETQLAPELWPIKVDPTQMEQILLNLAVNARDAMPQGGKLMIETDGVLLDEIYGNGHLRVEPGEYVRLIVTDTGRGMTPEVKSRIFEPYFTTKEPGKGTGLGLATVYGIIEQNKGHVWVYSEEGQGTSFKIYLPRAGQSVKLPRRLEIEEVLPMGHETILLAEDNQDLRILFSEMLKAQGYQVLVAKDGREALQLSTGHQGPIHLLLTDMGMPHLNGGLLAKLLSRTHSDLKVLLMSGYSDNALSRLDILSTASFLSKPVSPMTLVRKVREVLDAPSNHSGGQ